MKERSDHRERRKWNCLSSDNPPRQYREGQSKQGNGEFQDVLSQTTLRIRVALCAAMVSSKPCLKLTKMSMGVEEEHRLIFSEQDKNYSSAVPASANSELLLQLESVISVAMGSRSHRRWASANKGGGNDEGFRANSGGRKC